MSRNLNVFLSTALIAVSLLTPQSTYGMDEASNSSAELQPSGMQQLSQGANDTLEGVLGAGQNVLLRLSMDLSSLKKTVDKSQIQKGKLDIPVRLFLTDFMSTPTAHPVVHLTATVDVESTPAAYILPSKPSFFESYSQFTDWLNSAYFTNHVNMTYDFQVNVQQIAPSLAQLLFAVMPVYRFIGTYAVDNANVLPDKCVAQVTYVSKRGTQNRTIATLSGRLYLNDQAYPVGSFDQVFQHSVLDQILFKRDETKQFYSHKWVARSEVTAEVMYEEFPRNLIPYWPDAPIGSYSLLKKIPNDFEEINHLACWDGASGEEVGISDGRVLLMDCEAINKTQLIEGSNIIRSIVKDEAGNLYTTCYQYSELIEPQKLKKLREEARLEREELSKREALIDECINLYNRLIFITGVALEESNISSVLEESSKIYKAISALYQKKRSLYSMVYTVETLEKSNGDPLFLGSAFGALGGALKINKEFRYIADHYNNPAKLRALRKQEFLLHTSILRDLGRENLKQRSFKVRNTQKRGESTEKYIQRIRQYKIDKRKPKHEKLSLIKTMMKDDIQITMKFHQDLFGVPHPRWDELLKMG